MKVINKKQLSEIKEEKKEKSELALADIYEILIEIDDRLTAIEDKVNGGGK